MATKILKVLVGGKKFALVDDKHIYLQFTKQEYSNMVVKNIGIEN